MDSVEDRIIAPLLAALQRRGMEEEAGSHDARATKAVSGILREGRKELLQGTHLAELLATALRKDAAATVESEGGAQRGSAMTPVADESRRLLSAALAAGQEAVDTLATAEIGGLLAKDAVRPPSRPQDGAGCGLTWLRRSACLARGQVAAGHALTVIRAARAAQVGPLPACGRSGLMAPWNFYKYF